MSKIERLLKEVLAKIKPTPAEMGEERKLANELTAKIKSMEGKHVEVALGGSLARSTHLRGDRDIDIFVLFPEKMPREEFEREGLRIGKRIFRGYEWEEAYTEHPYIRGTIKGFSVEIVPSYRVEKAELLKSSVDRSPFHTKYLEERLSAAQRDEVRLLRQFLKGVGCYGADIKFCSFPGYVAELLILNYGDFKKTIGAVAKWKMGEVVDVGGHYRGRENEAVERFGSHLVVVDPTDRNRNVAAALSLTQYARFVAAARAFLKKPGKEFFFREKGKAWAVGRVRRMLAKKELVAAGIGYPRGVVADIMWGQLKRFTHKVSNQLEINGFAVNRRAEWTDEKSIMVALFELESLVLQKTMKRVGPDVIDEENSIAFLRAHPKLVAGPRIERGRLVIEVERKYSSAKNLLKDLLRKEKGVEKAQMRKALNKSARVMGEEDIIALYKKNAEFRLFLTDYLRGREEFALL